MTPMTQRTMKMEIMMNMMMKVNQVKKRKNTLFNNKRERIRKSKMRREFLSLIQVIVAQNLSFYST
jgi:hypothetical protein